jgi:hypothetical protein
MQNRPRDGRTERSEEMPQNGLVSHIRGQLDQTAAMLTAHCMITEALVHTLCFDCDSLSRARILDVLDLVYGELEGGLGGDHDVVKAFGDQRDSLRSMLVTSAIHAGVSVSAET